jgi:hypothetical protein
MDARAEQIVLDYLRLLGDAAQRTLSPDERQTFLARTRAAIARQVSETRVAGPGDVQRLLREFGDPQKLAAQERRRLDGATPAAARPVLVGRRPAAAPVPHRPLTARWRPGGDLTGSPGPVAPVLRTLSRWPDIPPLASRDSTGLHSEEMNSGRRRGPRSGPPAAAGMVESGPAADWLDGLFTLVRRHPLECAAVAVLGVGGLLDPVPLWMLGGLAVLISPLWDTRDKLTAIAVPMAVAVLGAIMLGGLNTKTASLSGYAHGVHTDGWDLIRVGAVLGAAYLAWRMREGPRPRRAPPRRPTPRA